MAIMAMPGQVPVAECQMSDRLPERPFFSKDVGTLIVDTREHRSHEVVSPSHHPFLWLWT